MKESLDKNIVLIGFMGTGKTTVGKRLAARLKREFVDTDWEVERVTGKTISQIFKEYGAIRFRSEENLVVKKLSQGSNLVIATGGGVVLLQENIDLLRQRGIIICLTSPPEIIYQRVRNNRNRPLLSKGRDLPQQIEEMLLQRAENYAVAEFAVDTGTNHAVETVDKIIAYLRERYSYHD